MASCNKKTRKDVKLSMKLCPEVEYDSEDLKTFYSDPLSFINCISNQTDNKVEVFKIKLKDDAKLKYQNIDYFVNRKSEVDEVDVTSYKQSESTEIYLRSLLSNKELKSLAKTFKSNEKNLTDCQLKTLQEFKRNKIPLELTVENIKQLVPFESNWTDLNECSYVSDVDNLIKKISQKTTVNILNLGISPKLGENTAHPFNPDCLITPDKFLNHSVLNIKGVFSPYIYLSFPGSHTPFHIEDLSLSSINVNAGGGVKLWINISSHELKKLIKCIKEEIKNIRNENVDNCLAAIRKKQYLITLGFLERNSIEYTVAFQYAGEIIITPPNCGHQVICLATVVNHTSNFIESIWCGLNPIEDCYICPTPRDCKNSHGMSWPSGLYPSQVKANFMNLVYERYSKTPQFLRTPLEGMSGLIVSDCNERCPNLHTNANVNENVSDNDRNMNPCPCGQLHTTKVCPGKICATCEKEFSNEYLFRRHMQEKHKIGEKNKTFQCSLCKFFSLRKDGLESHFRTQH